VYLTTLLYCGSVASMCQVVGSKDHLRSDLFCRELHGDRYLYPSPPVSTTLISIPIPIPAIVSTSSPSPLRPSSNHPRPHPSPQTSVSVLIPIKDRKVKSRFATTRFMLKKTAKSKQCGNAEWPVQQKPQKIQPGIAEIDGMGDI